jgi:uncharacterized protein with HEPN domain
MANYSIISRLTDIVEAIERIYAALGNITLDVFETDWQRQWIVERGIEIISEASRHLPNELKARYPDIPWPNVAGIGNVLRHDYGMVALDVLWGVVRDDLPLLEKVCREELSVEIEREQGFKS